MSWLFCPPSLRANQRITSEHLFVTYRVPRVVLQAKFCSRQWLCPGAGAVVVRKPYWVTTKGHRDRNGRTPAGNAEVYWEVGRQLNRSSFQQLPWSAATVHQKKSPQKVGDRAWNLPIPIGRSKNAPAPSAGGSPIPDGKAFLGKPLPFRTTPSQGQHVEVGFFQLGGWAGENGR